MRIAHHPDDATLMSFAAGSLPAALSAVVAAHIEYCPHCAAEAEVHDAIGAALLAGLAPEPLTRAPPALAAAASGAAVVATAPRRRARGRATGEEATGEVPATLQTFLGSSLDALVWRRVGRGIEQHKVVLPGPSRPILLLLRVAGGAAIPHHGHGSGELTLVLRGGYRDETGHYLRGDLADLDSGDTHEPVADAEGCICVVASDAGPRFSSPLVRLWRRLRP